MESNRVVARGRGCRKHLPLRRIATVGAAATALRETI